MLYTKVCNLQHRTNHLLQIQWTTWDVAGFVEGHEFI